MQPDIIDKFRREIAKTPRNKQKEIKVNREALVIAVEQMRFYNPTYKVSRARRFFENLETIFGDLLSPGTCCQCSTWHRDNTRRSCSTYKNMRQNLLWVKFYCRTRNT